jgi:hypothetical protein
MIAVWVLIMPQAAARFEQEILVPPFAHLPAGGIFVVASAAALIELAVGALSARMFVAVMRAAARRVRQRCRGHGYGWLTSGITQRRAGLPVRFGPPSKRTSDCTGFGNTAGDADGRLFFCGRRCNVIVWWSLLPKTMVRLGSI